MLTRFFESRHNDSEAGSRNKWQITFWLKNLNKSSFHFDTSMASTSRRNKRHFLVDFVDIFFVQNLELGSPADRKTANLLLKHFVLANVFFGNRTVVFFLLIASNHNSIWQKPILQLFSFWKITFVVRNFFDKQKFVLVSEESLVAVI